MASITQQTSNQTISPWAKHDDHDTHKLLHYANSRMEAELKLLRLRLLIPMSDFKGRINTPIFLEELSSNASSSSSLSTFPAVTGSAATNSMVKRYADTIATGNGASNIAITHQPNNVTINAISSPVENIRP
ncbi:13257_t:CDS:2 [Funneliformis geosporum]|uniref:588_t:CDS:1 n=1 Tax=Funneliformis geosporum TaxID=1117311 RepID=A0A9W4STX1_9GLOM|nr:588_t:CDS:2 [Funneliformis geosporum]CAI2181495.1 13257_t:CDS:2 [Funneliformis geosporum]